MCQQFLLPRRKQSSIAFLSLIMCALLLTSCAAFQTNPNLSDRAKAEQQADEWMSLYDIQYRDTMGLMSNPSTELQKDIGRQKRAILIEVYPLIKEYKDLVKTGKSIAYFDTDKVFNLMNKLAELGAKH